jgi:hypothetical protein
VTVMKWPYYSSTNSSRDLAAPLYLARELLYFDAPLSIVVASSDSRATNYSSTGTITISIACRALITSFSRANNTS